jgi:hypothetical protein
MLQPAHAFPSIRSQQVFHLSLLVLPGDRLILPLAAIILAMNQMTPPHPHKRGKHCTRGGDSSRTQKNRILEVFRIGEDESKHE